MMAFFIFRNGDRKEFQLTKAAGHIRPDGHLIAKIMWRDGDDGLGGPKKGERVFYLDVGAYRDRRAVRYIEEDA